jgi:hypothetical protein
LTLFTLTDAAEQDDNCASIYNKSLLYLVSNAFEATLHIPLASDGEPILGMEKFLNDEKYPAISKLFKPGESWILAPNHEPEGSANSSTAKQHGAFDDDLATVKATLARILDVSSHQVELNFMRSASSLRSKRKRLF